MSPRFALIVATTEERGIGYEGGLNWRLPEDMAYFKKATIGSGGYENVVIMGRKTWESIPSRFRPMQERVNMVISRNKTFDLQLDNQEHSHLVSSLQEALDRVQVKENTKVFVIGGAQIYSQAITHPDCEAILLTQIQAKIPCDAFFPAIDPSLFTLASHQALEAYLNQSVTEGVQHYKNLDFKFTDFSQPLQLASSTLDRYQGSLEECVERDQSILSKPYKTSANQNDYFKDMKWSPDGTCLLSNSADDILRLFSLPSNVYEEEQKEVLAMVPYFGSKEVESVYDMAWYPLMKAQDAETSCFLTSVKDHPVRLWDVGTGQIRASYKVIDHCERYIGPNVVRFDLGGERIYCGYENKIEIFDVQRPGTESKKRSTVATRKSKEGQKGIISCIDFSMDGLYAAGSYSQSIGIYDARNDALCLKLTGFHGGTTQVKFSYDGQYLFSASRHANTILCWDIRDSANVLYELPRPGKTNQRIHFDFDPTGTHLVTGDERGQLTAYRIAQPGQYETVSQWKAHQDLISCAAFNPVYPILATCSGQRKFENDEERVVDNSIQAWRVPGHYEWFAEHD